jgi:hypothetical protein
VSTDLTLPEPNIPLLRKAVEWAEAEAAKTDGTCLWDQGAWAQETDCGTAYCIAGFAAVNSIPNAHEVPDGFGYVDLYVDGEEAFWFDTGGRALGLTLFEAEKLFHAQNTIADVRRIAEGIAARAGERL